MSHDLAKKTPLEYAVEELLATPITEATSSPITRIIDLGLGPDLLATEHADGKIRVNLGCVSEPETDTAGVYHTITANRIDGSHIATEHINPDHLPAALQKVLADEPPGVVQDVLEKLLVALRADAATPCIAPHEFWAGLVGTDVRVQVGQVSRVEHVYVVSDDKKHVLLGPIPGGKYADPDHVCMWWHIGSGDRIYTGCESGARCGTFVSVVNDNGGAASYTAGEDLEAMNFVYQTPDGTVRKATPDEVLGESPLEPVVHFAGMDELQSSTDLLDDLCDELSFPGYDVVQHLRNVSYVCHQQNVMIAKLVHMVEAMVTEDDLARSRELF